MPVNQQVIVSLVIELEVAGVSEILITRPYRPQPTRRTSWKLVGNPGFELVSN